MWNTGPIKHWTEMNLFNLFFLSLVCPRRWLTYLLLLILDLIICLLACLGLAKQSRWLLTTWVQYALWNWAIHRAKQLRCCGVYKEKRQRFGVMREWLSALKRLADFIKSQLTFSFGHICAAAAAADSICLDVTQRGSERARCIMLTSPNNRLFRVHCLGWNHT